MLKKAKPYLNADSQLYITAGMKDEFLLMQAHIGVLAWPNSKNNRSLTPYENDWPFADHCIPK
jgi:hypothetical protein